MKLALFTVMLIFTCFFGRAAEPADVGKTVYESKCGRCHDLYSPKQFSSTEWEIKLEEMATLSGLTESDEKNVKAYLNANSGKTKEKNEKKFIIGGYLYTEYFYNQGSKNTFDAHYLSISMSGKVHKRVNFYAEFELEHGGGSLNPPFVEEAYLDLRFNRRTGLQIGAILTPFNKFDDFHGPLQNRLISRPTVSREIGVSAWKDVGVNLHGIFSISKNFYLNYDVYVINGLGSGSRLRNSRQYKDNNGLMGRGFRLSGIFNDKFEAGASFYSGQWDDEGLYDLTLFGFFFLGNIGELDLYGEYSKAVSENSGLVPDGRAEGYFIQGSYKLNRSLRGTVRYGTLDYLDMMEALGRSYTDIDKRVLAVGLNLNLNSSVVFKVEYDFVMEGDRAVKKANNVLAFQAAVSF